jgi:hypothetical protein
MAAKRFCCSADLGFSCSRQRVIASRQDSERAKQWRSSKPSLPPGRYLVNTYVDAKERLKSEWQSMLGEAEYVGEAIIETKWASGYGRMTVVRAGQFARTVAP